MTTRLTRHLEYIPVLGLFLRSARRGGYAERLAFVFNVVALWLVALTQIGYPLLIVTMLSLTALYLFGLVYLTSEGLRSRWKSRKTA
jgi:fatty acid desaturase